MNCHLKQRHAHSTASRPRERRAHQRSGHTSSSGKINSKVSITKMTCLYSEHAFWNFANQLKRFPLIKCSGGKRLAWRLTDDPTFNKKGVAKLQPKNTYSILNSEKCCTWPQGSLKATIFSYRIATYAWRIHCGAHRTWCIKMQAWSRCNGHENDSSIDKFGWGKTHLFS